MHFGDAGGISSVLRQQQSCRAVRALNIFFFGANGSMRQHAHLPATHHACERHLAARRKTLLSKHVLLEEIFW